MMYKQVFKAVIPTGLKPVTCRTGIYKSTTNNQ
jgi:hypothetical protein